MNKPCILIMAGGTGGHVFPALAVANSLQEKGWAVHWLGTHAGLEAKIIPKTTIPIHYISVQGLRGKSLWTWCLAAFQLILALYQALRVLAAVKPTVVLGMGGFISGPGGIAAWLRRCPLIIHEQNAIAGTSNRCLSRMATQVLEAFPGAFKARAKAICTGNPVREGLLVLPRPKERFISHRGPLRLVVLGGSRGALALNQLCPVAIQKIPLEQRPEIWHQTGIRDLEQTQVLYQKMGVVARVQPFIDDMAAAYSWADLVLCRAGALTISELAAVGLGSILVPFPFATDDHQTRNGQLLEKIGAAELIPQSILSPEKLVEKLLEFSADRERLLAMAEAAFRFSKRDALSTVTRYCEETSKHADKKS